MSESDGPQIWKHGIVPYTIDERFNRYRIRQIKNGMRAISSKTCIKFVKRKQQEDYVFIRQATLIFVGEDGTYETGSCSSLIGRQGGMQIVNLAYSCMDIGTVIHELLHALGIVHEHCRHDRDNFVKIIWKNIKHGEEHNFEKVSYKKAPTFGLPYDFRSVMHYAMNAFAIDPKKPTIKSKVKWKRVPRKHIIKLSKLDILEVNYLYDDCS